jgi:tRNA (cmo5U34)-methyltransferase
MFYTLLPPIPVPVSLTDEVKRAFDAGASRYDAQRKRIIPDFEGFYGAAVWAAIWPGRSPVILDIGAGTGLLSEMILKRYPDSTLTLLDISENMLDVARRRLQGRTNVRFLIADYSQEEIGDEYDVIVSALSIHHLTHPNKRRLYERVFKALSNGGVFVNAEQVRGESAWLHRRNMKYWDEFILKGDLPQQEAEEIRLRRDTYDHMEKLSVQLGWMRKAGYSDVDVIYKNRPFAVFSGRKTGTR